jgi:glycosyltransferase involved in cell wall biosynthesis
MKVALVTNQLSHSFYGGGDVQLIKTQQMLSEKGVDARFFTPRDVLDKSNFDIVHIFGPTRFPFESLMLAEYAKEHGVKVACSPIFWIPYPDGALSRVPYVKGLGRISLRAVRLAIKAGKGIPLYGLYSLEKLMKKCDVLLPNTQAEADLLHGIFGIERSKFRVVPNAVDLHFRDATPAAFVKEYGVEDFILFSGRVEKRKNVLRLIRAFEHSGLDTKLVIMGRDAEPVYYAECKRAAGKNVVFVPHIPPESAPLLMSAYKAAKVVVLPSYYETPGLSVLEGGLAGANVVVTKIGGTMEYFGKHAWYVDPFSVKSIERALVDAYRAPKSGGLASRIEKNFNWDRTAEETLKAYRHILGDR